MTDKMQFAPQFAQQRAAQQAQQAPSAVPLVQLPQSVLGRAGANEEPPPTGPILETAQASGSNIEEWPEEISVAEFAELVASHTLRGEHSLVDRASEGV